MIHVLANGTDFERLRIFNTQGREVYNAWINGTTRIVLPGLAAGMYICKLGEDRPITQKITVTH